MFLLGHSMGSFLARDYVIEDSRDLAGLVLSATGGDPGWVGKVGPVLALTEARLRGRRHVSPFLQNIINGPYNAAFKPNRTNFDWLSRDEAEVDKYVADELCGRTATSGFFYRPGHGGGPHERPTSGGPGATGPSDPHHLG